MNLRGISVLYIIQFCYIFFPGICLSQRKASLNLCAENPGFHPNGDNLPRPGSNLTVYVNRTSPSFKCLMKFTTCSNCRFIVNSLSNFTLPECHGRIGSRLTDCIQRCTYLLMFDVDYKNETATMYHQGPFERFIGESHVLYVMVCADNSRENIQFGLSLTVEKKIQKIRGSSYDDSDYNRYVLTPFFPNYYAENDEEYVYKFEAVNRDEYIQLIFDDWHLSPASSLQFENSNVEGPIYGSSYRPTIISNGHYLNMNFKTGKKRSNSYRNYVGFKVSYEFHRNQDYVQRYRTNCGGYLLNLDGGTIMFDGETATDDYYDCIWVVKKQPDYDSIFIKVENFSPSYYMGQRNSLQIRDGLTSLSGLRETLTSEESSSIYGYVSTVGFYIRLKGRYREKKDFIVTYASYKHGECRSEKYFRCDNRKCINSSLKCDGFNHCGDGSDEKTSRCGGNGSYTSSPYSYSLSVGVIIPIVISVFLIVVICLLIIFIRRCRKLSSLPMDGRQRIQTVSGQNASRGQRGRNRQRISMNLTISQDAPPTYEEVVRSTPIGHLNMAFMWSQSDIGMIQPPSYEEATSPQATQATQFVHQNISSGTSDRTMSSQGHPPMLNSSSDESFQQCNIQISPFSSSHPSGPNDRQIMPVRNADTSHQVRSPSSSTLSAQPKNEFLSPVGTSGHTSKRNDHQTISNTQSIDAEASVLSPEERSEKNATSSAYNVESSQFYDQRGIQEHNEMTEETNAAASGSKPSVLQYEQDIDPHRALGEYDARKRRHGEPNPHSHKYSNSNSTPSNQISQRQNFQSSQNCGPVAHTRHQNVPSRFTGVNDFVNSNYTDEERNLEGAMAESLNDHNHSTSRQSPDIENSRDDSRPMFLSLRLSSDPQDDTDVFV